MIMDNKLSVQSFLAGSDVHKLSLDIRNRVKLRRLERNLTQVGLARASGVSLGTLKWFERSGEISLKHLLMLAVALQATEEFMQLFTHKTYQSINEVIRLQKTNIRQRGRLHA
jgi:transcriptional regulator with XRE-family HTH domain